MEEWQDAERIEVTTTACKRLFSLGCVPHTDGAVFQARLRELEASSRSCR